MRRLILAWCIALGWVALAHAQEPTIRPHREFVPVGIADTKWTSGFWADRFETCRLTTVPEMGRLMEGTERSQFLHNFRIAAGEEQGMHRGPPWNDGDFYKWLEAAAAVYAITKDDCIDRQMDTVIGVISRAQRADGYLHTPVLIKHRAGDFSAQPFADRLHFEMYNFGHLFTAACTHHAATGKKNLLGVAVKAADFVCDAFKNPTPALARNSVCPAHYMGILDLYRSTGDKRYLRLAERWMAMRQLTREGTDDNQDRIPFREQTEAVGHAVRANYLYAGAADLYAETGDQSLLGPLMKIWENAIERKMYITGACGALFDGASPAGAKDQKEIARTHQAYGRDYQLPNSVAHNESCASIGNVLWNWRMLSITGDGRYADVMERALYNAVLAAISLDGKKFFYTNTLRQLDSMPSDLRWSRTREAWISCYCCPPNVARILAQVNRYAYGKSASTIWVHLYGSNSLDTELPDGSRVRLRQETNYPWDGKVVITVDAAPKSEMAIQLRIPGWARGAALRVKGEESGEAPVPGRYVKISRQWAVGDTIVLTMPMPVRMLEAHPLLEEARNHVALQRGPLVYCLESTDLGSSAQLMDVRIPRATEWTARHEARLLGGVTVLDGRAIALADKPWGKALYREVGPERSSALPVRLIPYYAWSNRGASEMTVWLPLMQ